MIDIIIFTLDCSDKNYGPTSMADKVSEIEKHYNDNKEYYDNNGRGVLINMRGCGAALYDNIAMKRIPVSGTRGLSKVNKTGKVYEFSFQVCEDNKSFL